MHPLTQFRKRRKWSLRKMAAAVSAVIVENDSDEAVSASTVLRWESGKSEPSLFMALAIRKVCGRSVPLPSLLVRR